MRVRNEDRCPMHTRDEARRAKLAASEQFRHDTGVTSVGIGWTEDRSDYAVTITIAHPGTRLRIPTSICDVPVRVVVVGEASAF